MSSACRRRVAASPTYLPSFEIVSTIALIYGLVVALVLLFANPFA